MVDAMSIDWHDLRGVFEEQERTQNAADEARAQRLEIERERLELAKAREQRQAEQQRQRLAQQERQVRSDNIVYITSIAITFCSILASMILFVVILIKG